MRLFTLLFILSLSGLPLSHIHAADKVPYYNRFFGHLDMAVEIESGPEFDESEIQDHYTRFGFTGGANNEDLTVYYHAEWSIRMANSQGKTLIKRRMGLGLRGDYGDIFFGRHDSPFKYVQQKVDVFSDLRADLLRSFNGEIRRSDMMVYRSPWYDGVSLMIGLQDDDTTPGFDVNAWSAATFYKQSNYSISYGQDKDIETKGLNSHRLAAMYRQSGWQFGALVQQADLNGNRDTGLMLSAKLRQGNHGYKFQFSKSDIWKLGIRDSIRYARQESLGWDYHFNKFLRTYINFTHSTVGETEEDDTLLAFGMVIDI